MNETTPFQENHISQGVQTAMQEVRWIPLTELAGFKRNRLFQLKRYFELFLK